MADPIRRRVAEDRSEALRRPQPRRRDIDRLERDRRLDPLAAEPEPLADDRRQRLQRGPIGLAIRPAPPPVAPLPLGARAHRPTLDDREEIAVCGVAGADIRPISCYV